MCHGEEVVDLVVAWLKVRVKAEAQRTASTGGNQRQSLEGRCGSEKDPGKCQQENLPFEYLPGASPDEQGSI